MLCFPIASIFLLRRKNILKSAEEINFVMKSRYNVTDQISIEAHTQICYQESTMCLDMKLKWT